MKAQFMVGRLPMIDGMSVLMAPFETRELAEEYAAKTNGVIFQRLEIADMTGKTPEAIQAGATA